MVNMSSTSFPIKAHKRVLDEIADFEENYIPLLVNDFERGLRELTRHSEQVTPDMLEAYLELTQYAMMSEESPLHFGYSDDINETTLFGLMVNERIAFQDIHILNVLTITYMKEERNEEVMKILLKTLRSMMAFAPFNTSERRVLRRALDKGYVFYVLHRDYLLILGEFMRHNNVRAFELFKIAESYSDYVEKYKIYFEKREKITNNVVLKSMIDGITNGRSYIIDAIYYNSSFQLSSFTDDKAVVALSDSLLQGALDTGFSRYKFLDDEYMASSYLKKVIDEIKSSAESEAKAVERFSAFKEVVTKGFVDYLVSKNKINPSSILVIEKKHELSEKIFEAVIRARERGDLRPQELRAALSQEDPEKIKEQLELAYEDIMSKGLREAARSLIDAIANAQTLESAIELFKEFGVISAAAPLIFSGIGTTAMLVPLVPQGSYLHASLAILQSITNVYSLGAAFKALTDDFKKMLKMLRTRVVVKKRKDTLIYNTIKSNSYALIKALNKVF